MTTSLSNPILVTGASGFLGRHLLSALPKGGGTVFALSQKTGTGDGNITWLRGDLFHEEGTFELIESLQPAVVFHLAGGRYFETPPPGRDLNKEGTLNLLKALARHRPLAVITVSTSEVYGLQRPPLHESLSPHPLTPYAKSKYIQEEVCRLYAKTQSLPVVILRPFTVYGPGQPKGMLVGEAIRAALKGEDFAMTEGTQARDWVYVADVVEGMLRAAETPAAAGEIINLGAGRGVAVLEVVERIFRLTAGSGKPFVGALSPHPNEPPLHFASTEKAEKLLRWRAKTSLEEGLQATVQAMIGA